MRATISINIEDNKGESERLDGVVEWNGNYGEYLRFMSTKKAMTNMTTFTKEQKEDIKKLLNAVAGQAMISFSKMRDERKEESPVGFSSLSKKDIRKDGVEAAKALKRMK
jgi:hypothetical protein